MHEVVVSLHSPVQAALGLEPWWSRSKSASKAILLGSSTDARSSASTWPSLVTTLQVVSQTPLRGHGNCRPWYGIHDPEGASDHPVPAGEGSKLPPTVILQLAAAQATAQRATGAADGKEQEGLDVFERRPRLQRSPRSATPPRTTELVEPRATPKIIEEHPVSTQIVETPKVSDAGEGTFDKFLLRKFKKLKEIMDAALTVNKRNGAYIEGKGNIRAEFKETRIDTDSEDTDTSAGEETTKKKKGASRPGAPRKAKATRRAAGQASLYTPPPQATREEEWLEVRRPGRCKPPPPAAPIKPRPKGLVPREFKGPRDNATVSKTLWG
ncbi:hypothetical protein WH47_10768 [Habropoda laboriosa]|uniref:Uncharacterized protein n=1 Tax=Habropoda laboriosa TaxID=597456 RepID=A0A0L7QMT8_9HYME|nr:hypothetical protein WH47_10768 [Habropoda laboriosa]